MLDVQLLRTALRKFFKIFYVTVLMSMKEWLQITFNRQSGYLFYKEYLEWKKGAHDLDGDIWIFLSRSNCSNEWMIVCVWLNGPLTALVCVYVIVQPADRLCSVLQWPQPYWQTELWYWTIGHFWTLNAMLFITLFRPGISVHGN